MNKERFEEVLQGMRDESASPEQVEAAQDRVWDRLAAARPLACDAFHADLAGYASRQLSESRRLLVEDHLSRCVECRHALAEVKGERKVVQMPVATPSLLPSWTRWAVAAGVVLAVLYVGRSAIDSVLAPSGPRATVVSVSGTLYQPSGASLDAGAVLAEGEAVRTAAGSHAVLRLRDGSHVEMNQRTELSVRAALSGDTIRLDRGDIIVAAAEQGRRRLRVVTRDSIAVVKGTIFAVSSGTAGSLVSVVEGSVEVSQAGFEDLLLAGQQAASNPALGEVSMMQAISWSRDAANYSGLLVALANIEEQLALSEPSMRNEARLVPYLPTFTSAYFAIPNLDGTIEEALQLLDQRAPQNTELGEWWFSESGQSMREVLEHLQGVTALLGDELVFVLTGSKEPVPLFLAQVRPGRHEELQRLIEGLADDPSEAPPFQVTEDLLLASDTPANLALLSAQLGGGASTSFAAEIAAHYQRGVGWLAAIDVAAMNAAYQQEELSRLLGLSSMRYLFLEQRSGAAGDETEATLSFSGARQGMASWLAAPGGIGSAEYISPDVIAASSGSTRDPREAFDQLLSALGPESEMMEQIRELEAETGIDMRDDIAASLGTDFVIAIEGLSLTGPQVVVVAEVLNAGALDEAVRRLVATFNRQVGADQPEQQLSFTEEVVDGRTWNVLSEGGSTAGAVSWTYDHGYLVASPNRAVALRAIAVRDSASSLIRSAKFQQQFPSGGGIHNSGFLWLDVGRFAEVLASLGWDSLGLENRAEPVLVVITGDDDWIRWASRARLTSLIFDFLLI